MVKNLPANPGEAKDTSLIPGSGRSPGVGNGNPLQYCCLEKSMVRGGVAKSQTRLSDWACKHLFITGGHLNLGHCMKSKILKCETCVQCWASEKHWLRSSTEDLSHTLHWILTTNCLSNWFPYCTSPQKWGLEKEMATHSSSLAWRISWTEEPGGLLPMGLHRVGHDWSDLAAAAAATRGGEPEIPRNLFTLLSSARRTTTKKHA